MKHFKITTKYLLLTAVLLVAAPGAAFADEDPVCPALYPCDAQGELLSIFEGSTDACAIKFAALCKRVRAEDRKSCAAVSDQYNSLQQAVEDQKTKFNKLQRKFRKLKNSK